MVLLIVSTPVVSIMPSLFDPSDVRPASTAKMDSVCLRLLPEGRSITGKIDAHGVSKVAKANSNSSNRQKAASVKALVDTKMASKRSLRNQRERSRRKALKQVNALHSIQPDPKKAITHEAIKSSIVFVDGGDSNNPRICPQLPTCKKKQEMKPMLILSLSDGDLSSPKTHLHDPERGLILPGSPSQIILVPRVDSLKHTGMLKPNTNISLINALDAVSEVSLSSSTRGQNRIVIRDRGIKYCCVGNQVRRNRVGIKSIHSALKSVHPKHSRQILSYFRQVEHLFFMYIDSSEVRHIRAAVGLVNAPTFNIPPSNVKGPTRANIYGAHANGINVFLQAHDDNDFTYGAVCPHTRTDYVLTDRPVVHFTFPRLGIAIPLRPGDVMFFNPKEPHCVSSRSRAEDKVYIMSLYLKSANIGLNNNAISLTPSEASLLTEYNMLHSKAL